MPNDAGLPEPLLQAWMTPAGQLVAGVTGAGVLFGSGVKAGGAASVNFKPANPANTVSTAQVMMGLGSTVTFKPLSTGLVQVAITGGMNSLTAQVDKLLDARFGTGAPPANGAALTGSVLGGVASQRYAAGSDLTGVTPFAFTDLLQLVAGTAYWFDLALATLTAADAALVQNLSFTLVELAN